MQFTSKNSGSADYFLFQTLFSLECREKANIHEYCMLILMKTHRTERQLVLSALFSFCFVLESRYSYLPGHSFRSNLNVLKLVKIYSGFREAQHERSISATSNKGKLSNCNRYRSKVEKYTRLQNPRSNTPSFPFTLWGRFSGKKFTDCSAK